MPPARARRSRSRKRSPCPPRRLPDYDLDLPFVLLYALDPSGQQARLIGSTGLKAGTAACPDTVDVGTATLRLAPRRKPSVRDRRCRWTTWRQRLGPPPCGPYPEPPNAALVLPITPPGPTGPPPSSSPGSAPACRWTRRTGASTTCWPSGVTAAVANARAYEEERKRAEALAELDRAKTAFFSNVSHEFRTPLTLMLGPVEDLLGPQPRRTVARRHGPARRSCNRNGLRLLRLVNTLLDFSRIEAGRVRAVYQPTDLAAYTAELASVFRAAVERAGLRLAVDCPPLAEPVFVDREMWEKVVLNLLSNAFKFTFEGEIAVTLRRAGDIAELVVRDTGTGIPAEEMPRLFERFHRVENARGRTHEGSGIGLALVQELVKLHGGSIAAESVVGTRDDVHRHRAAGVGPPAARSDRGGPQPRFAGHGGQTLTSRRRCAGSPTTYEPEATTAPTCRPTASRAARADISTSDAGGDDRPRVLVADDNADMRQYVVRLLAEHYRIQAVPDGEAALAAARERPPDLILTDVMMPRLDGFGLLRALRADPRTTGVPVIMLSARAGEESRVEGMEAGADDYLVKPFSAQGVAGPCIAPTCKRPGCGGRRASRSGPARSGSGRS